MRILISSAGRRVGLIGCFRDSFRRLGISGEILAADASPAAPALHFADSVFRTPPCDDPGFLAFQRDFASRERIDLIVPTIDTELPYYARSQRLFREQGTTVAISSSATVEICADKRRTHEWLLRKGFPVPEQQTLAQALVCPGARFPRILKPRQGSGSAGVRRIGSFEELSLAAALMKSVVGSNGNSAGEAADDWVVEGVASGDEYTVNVFVDPGGACCCQTPHRRVEVRGGEVSKAVTVRHAGLMRLARGIGEALPGARGPLSIQCFVAGDESVRITDINARFGGGYPLTHRAGARFTDWILAEWAGLAVSPTNEWRDNVMMLRYDREVFVEDHPRPATVGA